MNVLIFNLLSVLAAASMFYKYPFAHAKTTRTYTYRQKRFYSYSNNFVAESVIDYV